MNGHAANYPDATFDVLIVGAGISGINAAYRLQAERPDYTYAILEARDDIGGTWNLFRYPGIRSDSDLHSFGFPWYPWDQPNPIADGASIVQYMKAAAAKYDISSHILFRHKLVNSDWSTADSTWTLHTEHNGEEKLFTSRFVVMGTGYYNYSEPLKANIPGLSNFKGATVHPQFWPEDLDYADKKVVIIGSGATAVTLLPSIAEKASRVTMLQRSPTYIIPMPNPTKKNIFQRLFPSIMSSLARIRWVLMPQLLYLFCCAFPSISRWLLGKVTASALPKDVPYDPHFKPRYNPWQQRLCICPDGDFFKALHTDRGAIKTDTITQVTEDSIQLDSGEELEADMIITATGLKIQTGGGSTISIDGEKCDISKKYMWRGMMLQDIPNLAYVVGYAQSSWTLGADTTAIFFMRLLAYMEEKGIAAAVPRLGKGTRLDQRRLFNLTATYITEAEDLLPRAASQAPWKPRANYITDYWFSKYGDITDGMEFVKGETPAWSKKVR